MDKQEITPLERKPALNNTFTVYFSRFVPILLIVLLLIALPQLIVSLTAAGNVSPSIDYLVGDFTNLLDSYNLDMDSLENMDLDRILSLSQDIFSETVEASVGSTLLSIAFAILVTPLAFGAIAAISDGRARGEVVSLGEAFGRAGRAYVRLLVTNLCSWLLIFAFIILLTILMLVAILLAATMAIMSPQLGILIIILLVLAFVLPTVLIANVAGVAICTAMTGERKGFAAATYALKLLFSRFWNHVGLFLLLAIATAVAGLIVGLVLGIVLPGNDLLFIRTFVSTGLFGAFSVIAASMVVYSDSTPAVTEI